MKRSFAMLAAAISIALAGCSGQAADESAQESARGASGASSGAAGLSVRVTPVRVQPLSGGLNASGALVSREEAAVGSELSGYRVARVLVDEGQYVRQGQPLAVLDDTLLRAQIAQQQAVVNQQQVALQQQRSEVARVASLRGTGALSEEAIQTREFEARSAAAALAAAQAQLQELRTRQSRMTLRAPVSGVVLQRNLRPGDISAPGGEPYFRIARGSLVELDAEVAEADLARLRSGMPAQVRLPSGETVGGNVRFVSPRVDPQTRLGHVRVALPVRGDLRPGGFATAEFSGLAAPVLAVPEQAVQFDSDGVFVMTVGADNRVRRVPVRTGRRANGFVELVQGPPEGARVLLSGAAFVLEGDTVTPVLQAVQPPRQAAAAPAGAGPARAPANPASAPGARAQARPAGGAAAPATETR